MGRVPEKLITKKEVCEFTGLSRHQIDTARKNGMPHYPIGKRTIFFKLSEVQSWIRERRKVA